jgi:RNA-directed DNA polymerase
MVNRCETGAIPVHGNQQPTFSWCAFDRKKARRAVSKLQRRIYQATRNGDFRMVKRLQKLLFKSLPARFLAVLRVTSSKGRHTPGVDGIIIVAPGDKWNLVEALRFKKYKPMPVKIAYIPKPDGTNRKLGIPTIADRAMQALVLMAMEPEWEARFEPNSFGFRPGRGPIDAVQYISRMFVPKKGRKPHPGWILDADITACFDNIDHDALLAKVGGSPFKYFIKAWLTSGAISRIGFESSNEGTPQGGVISPLLANIALDGLERLFGIYTKSGHYYNPAKRRKQNKLVALFRYADDFIVLAPSRPILETHVIPKIKAFLSGMGLELNKIKSRVVNVSEGFDFLGFHFRRFFRKDGSIKKFTYHPRRDRLDTFLHEIKIVLKHSRHLPVTELIATLNRKIRGFCNYFRWSNAHRAFTYLEHRIYKCLWSWARHRHQKKRGRIWLRYRYWRPRKDGDWIFNFQGTELVRPDDLKVQWWKRPAVRIHSSPHDPAMQDYWQQRRTRAAWCNPTPLIS